MKSEFNRDTKNMKNFFLVSFVPSFIADTLATTKIIDHRAILPYILINSCIQS